MNDLFQRSARAPWPGSGTRQWTLPASGSRRLPPTGRHGAGRFGLAGRHGLGGPSFLLRLVLLSHLALDVGQALLDVQRRPRGGSDDRPAMWRGSCCFPAASAASGLPRIGGGSSRQRFRSSRWFRWRSHPWHSVLAICCSPPLVCSAYRLLKLAHCMARPGLARGRANVGSKSVRWFEGSGDEQVSGGVNPRSLVGCSGGRSRTLVEQAAPARRGPGRTPAARRSPACRSPGSRSFSSVLRAMCGHLLQAQVMPGTG